MNRHRPTFHAGETAVQDRAGVSHRTRDMAARAIRDAMPVQHRTFFEALPLVFLALLDRRGRPWAVPAFGPPGFVKARSPRRLVLHCVPTLANDLGLDMSPGARIGLIGLDFATRRRNRMNGRIVANDESLTIAVEQSFGNCPKYIQTRAFDPALDRSPAVLRRRIRLNSAATRRFLADADTFFIASRAADAAGGAIDGLDVSHRGGRPGFLRVNRRGGLSFPDFAGNQYFNTLGNIAADGRVGLVLPDFASGNAILLTGHAAIDWGTARSAGFKGAERMVDIIPEVSWQVEHALPSAARLVEAWPGFAQTGRWHDADPQRP